MLNLLLYKKHNHKGHNMILKSKVVIAISSRALFDLNEEHELFLKDIEAYEKYQVEHKNTPLKKGHAYNLIEKLLKLNTTPDEITNETIDAVEVIVISQNSVTTGRRISNSIRHYGLPIVRMVFTGGDNPAQYVVNDDLNVQLFLSHDVKAVKWALSQGIPGAVILSGSNQTHKTEIRIAFDGDAVLFSDESEQIFQKDGLDAFQKNEIKLSNTPLNPGPFKPLFMGLSTLAKHFPSILKIGLITARGEPAIERVLNSFDDWGLHPSHASFLGGISKKNFVKAFNADIFFDDHPIHCSEALNHVPTCHVPNGIANKE